MDMTMKEHLLTILSPKFGKITLLPLLRYYNHWENLIFLQD